MMLATVTYTTFHDTGFVCYSIIQETGKQEARSLNRLMGHKIWSSILHAFDALI